MVCHGALSRFPDLKIACVENGANWVAHLLENIGEVYRKMPQEFAENPVDAFKRNIYVNPFWEDDITKLIDLVGADHILFGSDYPHPEGLKDPISYMDELKDVSAEDQAKIMGGNLADLMHVGATV
jgi:predicted TIM-barrel fold metal-dependent hydrolase